LTAVAVAVVAATALANAALANASGDGSPLREKRGGVEIDWAEGKLAATGAAAADLRMPSAELARPGSLRRARAAALAKLRAALVDLPLGGGRTLPAAQVERALEKARTGAIAYQSNGGALVEVTLRFADWLEGGAAEEPPAAVLSVPAMHLAAAPLVKLGAREAAVGAARYRLGAPPDSAHALPARVDKSGRLALDAAPDLARKLAPGVVVIYVQKVLP
jgi:hypothetical protein